MAQLIFQDKSDDEKLKLGFQAMTVIRDAETGTGRHVPLVALTAHAMKGDREACLAAGADGYLSKPLNATDLFNLIESLTGHAASRPPAPTPSSQAERVLEVDPEEAVAPAFGDAPLPETA